MALSVGLCIVLTDNLTGPQTNGLLQACDTVVRVGTGSPVRVVLGNIPVISLHRGIKFIPLCY